MIARAHRRPLRLLLAVLLATAGAQLGTSSARACSYTLGPSNRAQYPWWSAERFPTNAMFTTSFEWRDEGGTRIMLVEDAEATARLHVSTRRPSSALPANSRFFTTEDCPPTGTCRHALEVGAGPDNTPPSRAVIRSLRTLLVEDPVDTGAFSCPDVDGLELGVEGSDDTTPSEHLVTVAYLGATEAEVLAKSEIDEAFAYNMGPPDRMLLSTIALGKAFGRERDGEPFRSPDRFCMSLALMDWAGNVGERSEARCLSTTDPNDPTVEMIAGQGCSCSDSGLARGHAPTWAGLVVLLAIGRRARRGSC